MAKTQGWFLYDKNENEKGRQIMLCRIFENILMFAISAKNSDIRLYYEFWIYRTYLTYDYWTYSYNAWYLHRIMIADILDILDIWESWYQIVLWILEILYILDICDILGMVHKPNPLAYFHDKISLPTKFRAHSFI